MGLRIAILGSAPSSVRLAPFNDPAWKVWACSPANLHILTRQQLACIDLWFEMHSWSLDDKQARNQPYISFLRQRKKPIIMQHPRPEFPTGSAYPLAEVRKRWPWPAKYNLTSSPALMMAMALLYKPEVIGLWGIDMATNSEYAGQRQGLVRWAEVAETLGVPVITPGEADVLAPPPLYGYVESTHMWRKMNARKRELAGRLNACHQKEVTAHEEFLVLKGAMEAVEYDMRTWLPQEVDEREAAEGEPKPPQPPMPPAEVQAEIAKRVAKNNAKKRNSTLVIGKVKPNGKAKPNRVKKEGLATGGTPSPQSSSDRGPPLGGSKRGKARPRGGRGLTH